MYFWQKTEGVILDEGNIDSKKTESRYENHSPSQSEGEWFSYLPSVLRKISYKLGKKLKNFHFFILYLLKQTRAEKIRRHL